MKVALTILGVVAFLMGSLWFAQGMGWCPWPASSFMINNRVWTLWGGLLAIVGVILITRGRRRN